MTKNNRGKHMVSRREAREFLMQVLYQIDVNGQTSDEGLEHYAGYSGMGSQKSFCEELYRQYFNHKEEIDEKISKYSVGWKPDRMPKTDLSILRLAACELLYMEDIPSAVSINEAVELTKIYGTDQSPKFVNAILGSITKEQEKA